MFDDASALSYLKKGTHFDPGPAIRERRWNHDQSVMAHRLLVVARKFIGRQVSGKPRDVRAPSTLRSSGRLLVRSKVGAVA